MRKVIFGALIAFILIAAAAIIERNVRNGRKMNGRDSNTEIKALNAQLKIKNFSDGKIEPLSQFKDNVVLMNFWASWCEACMVEMPSLIALQEKFKNTAFKLVLIDVDENPEKVIPSIIDKFKITSAIYGDVEENLARDFGVAAIPFSAFIEKGLKLKWVESGDRDWMNAEVINEVEKALKE